MTRVSELNHDVFGIILDCLDAKSHLNFQLVCKQFHDSFYASSHCIPYVISREMSRFEKHHSPVEYEALLKRSKNTLERLYNHVTLLSQRKSLASINIATAIKTKMGYTLLHNIRAQWINGILQKTQLIHCQGSMGTHTKCFIRIKIYDFIIDIHGQCSHGNEATEVVLQAYLITDKDPIVKSKRHLSTFINIQDWERRSQYKTRIMSIFEGRNGGNSELTNMDFLHSVDLNDAEKYCLLWACPMFFFNFYSHQMIQNVTTG